MPTMAARAPVPRRASGTAMSDGQNEVRACEFRWLKGRKWQFPKRFGGEGITSTKVRTGLKNHFRHTQKTECRYSVTAQFGVCSPQDAKIQRAVNP